MNLGLKIFLLQIAGLILFATNNVIISKVLGPENVTPFSVINKLFSIFIVGYGMVMSPLWAAFTDAKCKGDAAWIGRTLGRLNGLFALTVAGIAVMVFLYRPIMKLWLRSDLDVAPFLVLLTAAYTAVNIWNSIYSQYLAAVNSVNMSLVVAAVNVVLFVGLSCATIAARIFDVNAMVIIMIVSMLPGTFVQPLATLRTIRELEAGGTR